MMGISSRNGLSSSSSIGCQLNNWVVMEPGAQQQQQRRPWWNLRQVFLVTWHDDECARLPLQTADEMLLGLARLSNVNRLLLLYHFCIPLFFFLFFRFGPPNKTHSRNNNTCACVYTVVIPICYYQLLDRLMLLQSTARHEGSCQLKWKWTSAPSPA